MVTFRQEVQAAETESLKKFIEPIVTQVIAATLGTAGDTADSNNDAVRAMQLRLRGYEMAEVRNHTLLHEKKTALREAIAAAGVPIKAGQGKKYTPDELLQILQARCEALQACGSSSLGVSIRATDDLQNLRKVLATGKPQYIADQVDRVLAVTGLLYG